MSCWLIIGPQPFVKFRKWLWFAIKRGICLSESQRGTWSHECKSEDGQKFQNGTNHCRWTLWRERMLRVDCASPLLLNNLIQRLFVLSERCNIMAASNERPSRCPVGPHYFSGRKTDVSRLAQAGKTGRVWGASGQWRCFPTLKVTRANPVRRQVSLAEESWKLRRNNPGWFEWHVP